MIGKRGVAIPSYPSEPYISLFDGGHTDDEGTRHTFNRGSMDGVYNLSLI